MRSVLIPLTLSIASLISVPAHAGQKGSGPKTIPKAECVRQQVTTCHTEFQLDGKGGTTQVWVCKKVPGPCVRV